jgi:xylan 1,4-beta-xylosidase
VRWTETGWFEALGGDLSQPFPIPSGGRPVTHGLTFSDRFEGDRLRPHWGFFRPQDGEYDRVRISRNTLHLAARGEQPADCSPLCFVTGDLRYEVEIEIERDPGTQAGLIFFYNDRLYAGMGFDSGGMILHRYGEERSRSGDIPAGTNRLWMRLENNRHLVTGHFSLDGQRWQKFDVQMEVSGYHHNTAYDFLSLRPAIYASRSGEARFRNLAYTGMCDLGG